MAATRNSRSIDLPAALAEFFARRLEPCPESTESGVTHPVRVCVALSGGRDSVALLHALASLPAARFPAELSALHVHHGLSPHADSWVASCERLCRQLKVPLRVLRVDVDTSHGEGLEAAARRARYRAFAACDADWLALAHHRDDQAETLLLNLLRGAGAEGLAGMPAERGLNERTRLVRPLLGVARADIERHVVAHGLEWVEDESNADTHLRRNLLRHEILPRLADAFPQPAVALARAAANLGEVSQLVAEVATADRRQLAAAGGEIDLLGFNALTPARRANLLRHELRRAGLRAPDSRYLAEMLRQLETCSRDAAPVLPLDGGSVRVFRGALHVLRADTLAEVEKVWAGEATLPWAGGFVSFTPVQGGGLSRARLEGSPLCLRPRQGGEHLRLDERRPSRMLKKLLQEMAIPPWERQRLPLLWRGDALVWVGGLGEDVRYRAAPDEPGLKLAWSSADGSAMMPPDWR